MSPPLPFKGERIKVRGFRSQRAQIPTLSLTLSLGKRASRPQGDGYS